MGLSTPSAVEASSAERFLATILCFGIGVGTSVQVVGLWVAGRAHSAGGAAAPVLALALLVAVASRSLALLVRLDWGSGDELGWIGLLVGAGLPVAFTRIGSSTAPLAAVAAGLAWGVWWLQGQVCARVLTALSSDLQHARRDGDLGVETQGAVFGALATAAILDLVAPAIFGGRPGRIAAVFLAAECGCGCVLVALVHRRVLFRRAGVEGAVVLPEFGTQNPGGVLAIATAAVVVGAVLPRYAGAVTTGIFGAFAHALQALLPSLHSSTNPGPTQLSPPRSADQAPAAMSNGGAGGLLIQFLAELLALGAIAMLGWGLIRLVALWVRDRRGLGWPPIGRILSNLWRGLVDLVSALWFGLRTGALWHWLSRISGGARLPVAPPGAANARREPVWERWGHPRARVRAAYRRLLGGARERGHLRPHWATPRRFRAILAPALPPDPDTLAAITRLYEEARYSEHPLEEGDARAAEAAAQEVLRHLRDSAGAVRRP